MQPGPIFVEEVVMDTRGKKEAAVGEWRSMTSAQRNRTNPWPLPPKLKVTPTRIVILMWAVAAMIIVVIDVVIPLIKRFVL
jgi:nitric oxide reductase large subunit